MNPSTPDMTLELKKNFFRLDLREYEFLLFELFRVDQCLELSAESAWGREQIGQVFEECAKWVKKEIGSINRIGDIQGCKLQNRRVKTPDGFKEAWKSLYEAGWRSISVPETYGGGDAPKVVETIIDTMIAGANTSFGLYAGLSQCAGEVIARFGTDEQRAHYCRPLFQGVWSGTMCLTEPHAGSDMGSIRTKAVDNKDGTYRIIGTKIFITSGDHDLAENMIHLVLARIEGAQPGTKGLTLFLVPKYRIAPDGTSGGSNDVVTIAIEKKMGIRASATCSLTFGEDQACLGVPVGGAGGLHQGINQMFQMMNASRIGVGNQAVGIASSAYLNALAYAKERRQGPSVTDWKSPTAPRVPIIEHADVRRMLLDMKARVDGLRALGVKLALHTDLSRRTHKKNNKLPEYHQGQIDLLVPVYKSYGSDQCFRICETAIQIYGGSGYVQDFPVEQYCRDSKILSIYEGTNHIQAIDLVTRKLSINKGKAFRDYIHDINVFVVAEDCAPQLKKAVLLLDASKLELEKAAFRIEGWLQNGDLNKALFYANSFMEIFGEITIGWLLLDCAKIAFQNKAKCETDSKQAQFYEGKCAAALSFAHSVLPVSIEKAKLIDGNFSVALDLQVEAFG